MAYKSHRKYISSNHPIGYNRKDELLWRLFIIVWILGGIGMVMSIITYAHNHPCQ